MEESKLPLWTIWGLGATQIIGYGTLYYAFSILVPDIARDIGRSQQWVFGAFSLALLVGSLAAPLSGRLADVIGAGRLMAAGSVGAALSLVATAMSPGAITFAIALALAQIVSAAVLYATAFTAIVQAGGRTAQTSIVHLTLIAGFASSLFWPATSWLHETLSWREVFLVYAGLNAAVCFPVHLLLGRLTSPAVFAARDTLHPLKSNAPCRNNGRLVFALMLVGFAVEGYALSAILVHMVPLTQALGLGAAGLLVAALFGPAQVISRLVTLVFGRALSQIRLAVIATVLLPIGLAILLVTAPWMAGAVLFAICVGLGSGLTSIVGGTLPLELFGREGYGRRIGWCTSAKQLTSAIAPVGMAASMSEMGVVWSLWLVAAVGVISALAFVGIQLTVEPRFARSKTADDNA
jgi:MFS family permease